MRRRDTTEHAEHYQKKIALQKYFCVEESLVFIVHPYMNTDNTVHSKWHEALLSLQAAQRRSSRTLVVLDGSF